MARPPFHAPSSTDDPLRFTLPVAPEFCVGPPDRRFMMGGIGLGSAILALEQATGRPLIWATSQYLSFAPPEGVVEIDVALPVRGRNVSQARAISRAGDEEIITVQAALGSRPDERVAQYVRMPDVPPPDAFDPVPHEHPGPSLFDRLDRRRIEGDATDHEGHARVWMRTLTDEPITPGLLAVFADFLPGAIPITRGSSSLDNTLRIQALRPTEWCLLDARISALGAGFFHGEMHLFAENGTLLATASQSGALPRHA